MTLIRIVVPVATAMWNDSVGSWMDRYKDTSTKLSVENLDSGPRSLECTYDETMVESSTVEALGRAEEAGASGAIIYCMSDPGLRAAKERLSIPVVGIGEASYHFASLIGSRFSVIATGSTALAATQARRVRDHLRVYALDHKCVSVRSVCIPVLDLEGRRDELMRMLLLEGQKARDEDGADTLVLGCGGMLGVAQTVSKELAIPVIDPAVVALKLCEAFIRLRLAQSKRCFGSPTEKSCTG